MFFTKYYFYAILLKIRNFGLPAKGRRYSSVTISHSVIIQGTSPTVYRFIRDSEILTLPNEKTIRSYVGPSGGETGMTPAIRRRIEIAVNSLEGNERLGSLQIDEMHVKMAATLDRVQDRVIGVAENDVREAKEKQEEGNNVTLANKMLCFYVTGILKKFKIPVAFYFVKQLTASQLYDYTIEILKGSFVIN